jgi:PAS domain S-box-containing protein
MLNADLSIEEKLERSEKEIDDLRYALDCSSIVAFTDSRGIITYVNDKFCEISKYARDELIGRDHRIINSGYHPRSFFTELWKTISSGKIWRGEIKNRAKDGTHYWVYTTIVPFTTPRGRPFKYVAIRTDITAEKEMHEISEQYRTAMLNAEKMASIGELAAGITHELGTPLTTIKGRMEMLQRQLAHHPISVEDATKAVDAVLRMTDRMQSIVRSMRSLTHDGASDPFQKVNLYHLIRDVVGFTSESFPKNGIQIHIDSLPKNLELTCQETQVSQVLVNLINNARDAVLQLEDRWIRIASNERDGEIDVSVTDSGRGIPGEISSKMMNPFYTTKPLGKGSGLGLSVSKSIVEKHGGRLWVDKTCPNTRLVMTFPKQTATLH